jgi:hypothetical protein
MNEVCIRCISGTVNTVLLLLEWSLDNITGSLYDAITSTIDSCYVWGGGGLELHSWCWMCMVLHVHFWICASIVHSNCSLCDQVSLNQVAESSVLCICIFIPCIISNKCQYQSKSDILHVLLWKYSVLVLWSQLLSSWTCVLLCFWIMFFWVSFHC